MQTPPLRLPELMLLALSHLDACEMFPPRLKISLGTTRVWFIPLPGWTQSLCHYPSPAGLARLRHLQSPLPPWVAMKPTAWPANSPQMEHTFPLLPLL